MSSTKVPCVIWTAEGCEEIHRRRTRVRSREYVSTLLKRTGQAVNQGGTADSFLFVLGRFSVFLSGAFLFPQYGRKRLWRLFYVYTYKTMAEVNLLTT